MAKINKKALSERDICSKYIQPAIEKAGWDRETDFREEVSFFTDGRIRRVRPNGNHREFVSLTSPIGLFTTGLHFGSGLGDWKTDHLYVMNRNGEVIELYVGLNGKPDPHQ